LPLFGPSNVRDSVGQVVGLVTDPANFVPGSAAVTAVKTTSGTIGFVDTRANLLGTTDSLERTSVDYYAALRSAAAQRRAALVADGKTGAVRDQHGDAAAISAGAD
jgi:phospholipid-binding lipoprotein MlaA